MVWAVAKATRIFAVAWSVRHTLKTLKKVSRTECETLNDYRLRSAACSDALIFWIVFGFIVFWEQYLEIFTRWIPGYYYCKSVVLVLISFPKLRINNLAFNYIVVPVLELFYGYMGSTSIPSAVTMLRLIPLLAIAVLFPNVVYHELGEKISAFEIIVSDDKDMPDDKTKCGVSPPLSPLPEQEEDEEENIGENAVDGEEEEEDAPLWEADYSTDVFVDLTTTTDHVTAVEMSVGKGEVAPLSSPQHLRTFLDESEGNITMPSNQDKFEPSNAHALNPLPITTQPEYKTPPPLKSVGATTPMTSTIADTINNPLRTPARRPSVLNQAMLSGTARRLSHLAECYPSLGSHKKSPSSNHTPSSSSGSALDSNPSGVASVRRASQLSPALPQLNRRFSRRPVLEEVSPHGQTRSPMHPRTVSSENTDENDVFLQDVDRNIGPTKKRRNAVPPMTPPRSYVDSAFTKENRENTPNTGSLLRSVRSMWTGDSNLSIRESLRNALDVHTPPPNSMARGRRASAMYSSQGTAASVVASAQSTRDPTIHRTSTTSSGATRRQTALPRVSSYVTNSRRSSTAPSGATTAVQMQTKSRVYNTQDKDDRSKNIGPSNKQNSGTSSGADKGEKVLPALRSRVRSISRDKK